MSRDSGTEQPGQRTVAELLALYGGDAQRNGRRRRRRAEEPRNTAPQEIIKRVTSESGPMGAVPPSGQPPPAAEAPPGPAVRDIAAPMHSQAAPAPQRPATDRPEEHSANDHRTRRFTAAVPPRPADPTVQSPPFGDVEATAQQPVLPMRPQSHPPRRPAVPDEPTRQVMPLDEPKTEQFSPFIPEPVADPTETVLPAALTSYPHPDAAPELFEADDSYGTEWADHDAEEIESAGDDSSAPADSQDEIPHDDAEPERAGSVRGQWPAVALQVGAGMLGGAAVWVGFRLLWLWIPVVAVAAAVVVTGFLVYLARRSSGTGDLQTVALAGLVGVACTVSPVAVMLLGQ